MAASSSRASIHAFNALAIAALSAAIASADPVRCTVGEGLSVQGVSDTFHVYRPGFADRLRWRDLEFMVDTTYFQLHSPQTVNQVIERFASGLVDSTGHDAFRTTNISRFRLLWDYFRRSGTPYDPVNPFNYSAVALEDASYSPPNRSHADVYLVYPTRISQNAAPSAFTENDEDRSSNTPAPLTANSLMIEGPGLSTFHDPDGNGWTHPTRLAAFIFSHELQHLMMTHGSRVFDEMMSAGAEALAMNPGENWEENYDFPYTTSLIAFDNGFAYSSFMAYLAYNFRGTDSTSTLSATADDLMRLWAQGTPRTLLDLRDKLGDATCLTCAAKAYMPETMPNSLRLGLLVHNWRVANYVNNPWLDEGQYGFSDDVTLNGVPFAPWRQLGAWRPDDIFPENDVLSVPAEILLTSANRSADVVVDQQRTHAGHSYPLALQPYGSEYWVIRADPSLHAPGQDLHVRVSPVDVGRVEYRAACSGPSSQEIFDARLWVSIAAYRQGASPSDTLWLHPEWVHSVVGPLSVDVDSLRGPLEFFIPSFGDTVKAALVVITLGDGPSQNYSNKDLPSANGAPQRYQIQCGVRSAPQNPPQVAPFAATSSVLESDPVWSPDGSRIAYSRMDGAVTQIYLKELVGGSQQKLMSSSRSQRLPDWSPRGDWLVFAEGCVAAQCERLIARDWLTGTTRVIDSTSSSGSTIEAAFSPDGQRLAHTRRVAFGPAAGTYIRRVGLYGQEEAILARRSTSDVLGSVRWSPDGQWVYFVANDSLYAVGAAGATAGMIVPRSGIVARCGAFDLPRSGSRVALEEIGYATWLRRCHILGGEDLVDQPQAVPFRRVSLRDTAAADTIVLTYRSAASYYRPRFSFNNTHLAWSTDQDSPSDRDVYVGPVTWNHAPQFVSVPTDLIVENGPATYINVDLDASDVDGETATFAIVGQPQGSAFNATTGVFSWPHPSADSAYVVFRALDGSGGVAERVVRYRVFPAVPPAVVSDLNPDVVTTSSITLTWTAPGDDGTQGTAAEYDIRWSLAPITEQNWAGAYQLSGEPAPALAGTPQFFQSFSGLQPCTWYYIGIKTRDEAHNWSPLGLLHARTSCNIGGGGGESAGLGLEGADAGSPKGVSEVGSGQHLVIERGLRGSGPVWRSYHMPADSQTTTDGIVIQQPDGVGGWQTAAALPDSFEGEVGVSAISFSPRRYVFPPRYSLGRFATSVVTSPPDSGLALAALEDPHGIAVTPNRPLNEFAGMDTVIASYERAVSDGQADQSFVFVAAGVVATNANRASRAELLPSSSVLHHGRPNPFDHEVAIAFDIPIATVVRVTIHDIQGRIVRVLADRALAAGRHTLAWDRRCDAGTRVSPGVYLCRVEADSFRAGRKLVALP